MVEMKNSCDSCVHKAVCKYTEALKKSMDDIVKIANDHFEKYNFNKFMDLSIRCCQYVMAPYQEIKVERRNAPLDFYYGDIQKADMEKI